MGTYMYFRIGLIICLSMIPACNDSYISVNSESAFGIYLTRDEVPPPLLEVLSHIAPSDRPVISLDDIISYTWSSHVIHPTENGRRILDTLVVPTQGRSFLVCVNKSPKYHGAFWTPISSLSFVGTTIILSRPAHDSIRIGRGYPADSDTTRPDPRMNADVENVLRKAGKLL